MQSVWREYNPNPAGRKVGDCSVRAVSAAPPEQVEATIDYYSDTDFSQAIDGRQASEIWPIMDELMTVLQATNPRLYAGVMRKIED